MTARWAPSALALLCACAAPRAAERPSEAHARVSPSSSAVVIDGEMTEWTGHPPVVADSLGDDSGRVDLRAVSQQQDAQYVYLHLLFRRPVSLLSLGGTLSLAFDADGDAATGAELEGLPGADFAIDWSPRDSSGHPTEGVALRVVGPGGLVRRTDAHESGLTTLPGVLSRSFELRVARGRQLGEILAARPTFTGSVYRARLAYHDASGSVRDALPAFTVRLAEPYRVEQVAAQLEDPLRRANGTAFRMLQWNTADHGLMERPEVFRRIIRALDPDVLMLHEVNGELGREGMARFLASLDTASRKIPWRFSFGGGGGYQRSIVASRNAVTEFSEFRFIPYPRPVRDSLLALAPAASRERLRTGLDAGLATGGAVVELAGGRMAAFPLDLQSAGNDPASWQERRRRWEARLIREHAARALERLPRPDGVVVAGDFNLVATDSALRILLAPGLAPGLEPMRAADARQLDGRTAATWDAGRGPFTPGRLDWFLYGGGTLVVRRSFVFDARDLSDRWLAAHGLRRDDTDRASDHMPIVVDFDWRR